MHPDAEKLLSEFPAIETVEALITDCNGAARGKWLPADKLDDLLSNGIKLPKSFSMPVIIDLQERFGLPANKGQYMGELNVGNVEFKDGKITYNGQELNTGSQNDIIRACRKLRRR